MMVTMSDAHREWHLNAGVPMGQPGCPQDACHLPDEWEPELASQTAIQENIRVLEGETWEQYRDRYHSQHAGDGRRRPDGKCHCPHAYSLCVASMYWRFAHRDLSVHGGWGWPTEWHDAKSRTHKIALLPAAIRVDGRSAVGWAVETYTSETHRRCDRETFADEQAARDYANLMWGTH